MASSDRSHSPAGGRSLPGFPVWRFGHSGRSTAASDGMRYGVPAPPPSWNHSSTHPFPPTPCLPTQCFVPSQPIPATQPVPPTQMSNPSTPHRSPPRLRPRQTLRPRWQLRSILTKVLQRHHRAA
eukprot:s1543_g9.t1